MYYNRNMSKRDDELIILEKLAESFSSIGNFAQILRGSEKKLRSGKGDIGSRLEQVNAALRKSLKERNRLEHYLNNILESLDSAVIVTDRNRTITVFNSSAEKYTEIKAKTALGQKLEQVIDLALPEKAFESLLDGKKIISGNLCAPLGNGDKIPLAYKIKSLQRENSRDQAGILIILHNLSDIKKLEDDLRQVSNLAALGEMAATVAHEIRNPLSGIAGFTALLLRDLDKESNTYRLVEKINQGVASLNGIVASLLDYTRNISPSIAEVDAVSVIEEAVTDLRAIEKGAPHDILVNSGTRKLKANLDPQLFRMVVFNLVKNAMQASPDGGHIRLTLKRTHDNKLNLIVDDDGPGIPQEAFEKLFTPFFTTRSEGTGLGLATVKKITELHGGRVAAQNRPDGGARFVIEIPDRPGGVSSEAQNSDCR